MGILKKKKYSLRTFHTYLARCSLSIDSEAFGFFFPREKIFFSVICFLFWIFRFVSRKPEVAGSVGFRIGHGIYGVFRACVCVRLRARVHARACACVRLLAPITFGSMF